MKLSLHDKTVVYHELAKLTASGFGFDKSAELLLQQAPNRATTAFAGEILKRLRAGQSIADSVHQTSLGIEDLEFLVIQSAEHGGVLETGFAYLRDHYDSLLRVRREIQARLLYPAILLHLALFLPVIPSLLLGAEVRPLLLESVSFLLLIYAVAGLVWLGWSMLHRTARHSAVADRILSLLPLFGKARRLGSLKRFAAVLRISLLAALRTSEALKAAGKASGTAILEHAALRLAETAERGDSLASALPRIRDLPPDFRRSLATAELSGTLEQDLKSWATSFDQELERHWIRMRTLLPMAATLIVAVFVGWRLVTLYFDTLNCQLKILEGY